ncbi:MAG TPA: hypothetical protein VEL07_22595 [Planctomycetota bacterium]|nr:hypothetical protein [Planctomycetota bacterium]
MRFLFACLLVLFAIGAPAVDFNDKVSEDPDDSEVEADWFRGQEAKAAKYRLGRAQATAEDLDDAAAREYLDEARQLLADGHGRGARKKALKGFKNHRYSQYADDLQHVAVLGYAKKADLSGMLESLVALWLCFPDHPEMDAAMRVALDAAEKRQNFSTLVNLEAEDPADVIDLEGESWRDEYNRVFRFLSRNGDRESIAPRASLGLARSLLISEDRKGFPTVRAAYESFLDDYPDHELTFTALTELALAYLSTYRGEHYDVGALVNAAAVIDQAEIETGGDAARAKVVQDYRRRIRAWHQDRDGQVATWYDRRGQDDAARIYYAEVVARDPNSDDARRAERALDKLGPPPTPEYVRDLTPAAARP